MAAPTITTSICASGKDCVTGSICSNSGQCATGNCCGYQLNMTANCTSIT